MIDYDEEWLCTLLFRVKGSVAIRACCFAVPSALLAALLIFVDEQNPTLRQQSGLKDMSESVMWSALSAVTLVLLAFRTKQALSRFWEGTGLLHMMRGEWYDSVSCLITFSKSAKKTRPDEVADFRHTLVRIMSLCHGSALQEIQDQGCLTAFEAIDVGGLDRETLTHLKDCKEKYNFNRVEVLLHLIQSLVTTSYDAGILQIPAPILSRVFQTLSRGFVNHLNAKKIKDTKFPFPYAQLITALIFMLTILTPMYVTNLCENYGFATLVTFVALFGMCSLNFAAVELENPYGLDDNDLPLCHFQEEMNTSLLMLLHHNADQVPNVGTKCVRNFEALVDPKKRVAMRMTTAIHGRGTTDFLAGLAETAPDEEMAMTRASGISSLSATIRSALAAEPKKVETSATPKDVSVNFDEAIPETDSETENGGFVESRETMGSIAGDESEHFRVCPDQSQKQGMGMNGDYLPQGGAHEGGVREMSHFMNTCLDDLRESLAAWMLKMEDQASGLNRNTVALQDLSVQLSRDYSETPLRLDPPSKSALQAEAQRVESRRGKPKFSAARIPVFSSDDEAEAEIGPIAEEEFRHTALPAASKLRSASADRGRPAADVVALSPHVFDDIPKGPGARCGGR